MALGFVERMAAPAVTLMFNGSSYHALPALLSDLHEALAGVANDTDHKAGAVMALAHGANPDPNP